MLSHTSRFKRLQFPRDWRNERGLALLLVLLTLLILSAIGLGMMYMSDTEAAVNTNYRDSQLAFFAMRSGLEEARDRMRIGGYQALGTVVGGVTLPSVPAAMPGTANSIVYIINPSAGETVDPKTAANAYFDDEFCHENFGIAGLTVQPPGTPCQGSSEAPPSGSVAPYVTSYDPNTGTANSLKFKWVRITLKQNRTVYNGNVDSTQPAATQICFQTLANQEIPLTLVPGGGGYATCAAAQAASLDASPVYVVTALAVTPNGSRRVGQYEVAPFSFVPPGGALGLDGPAASFSPRPSSNNYYINGTDSGAAGYSGPGACSAPGATVPAISTGDAGGATTITTTLTANPNRSSNYTGAGGTPSVVNEGGAGGSYGGEWASTANLDSLVSALSNRADVTYQNCWASSCSPSGNVGTNANPQITYVDGDFNYGNASGAGVLIVTGKLSLNGNASFNGLILAVGQGVVTESGGGNGGFNGTIFVAKTHSSPGPGSELANLGPPTYSWNGGGKSFVQYNSCWANVGNISNYTIVDMREEMY